MEDESDEVLDSRSVSELELEEIEECGDEYPSLCLYKRESYESLEVSLSLSFSCSFLIGL